MIVIRAKRDTTMALASLSMPVPEVAILGAAILGGTIL